MKTLLTLFIGILFLSYLGVIKINPDKAVVVASSAGKALVTEVKKLKTTGTTPVTTAKPATGI